jgi:hypothetical protein
MKVFYHERFLDVYTSDPAMAPGRIAATVPLSSGLVSITFCQAMICWSAVRLVEGTGLGFGSGKRANWHAFDVLNSRC